MTIQHRVAALMLAAALHDDRDPPAEEDPPSTDEYDNPDDSDLEVPEND